MSETKRETKFWSVGRDHEHLTATSVEEAVEQYRNECWPNPVPDEVEVVGYAERELPAVATIAGYALETMCEWLDENDYGYPDEPTEPTDALREAAAAFAQAVREHFPVWACEEVEAKAVRTAGYPAAY